MNAFGIIKRKKVWLPIFNSFFTTNASTVEIALSKIRFWALLMVSCCFGGYLSFLTHPCLLAGGIWTCCWGELCLQSVEWAPHPPLAARSLRTGVQVPHTLSREQTCCLSFASINKVPKQQMGR